MTWDVKVVNMTMFSCLNKTNTEKNNSNKDKLQQYLADGYEPFNGESFWVEDEPFDGRLSSGYKTLCHYVWLRKQS